MINLNFVSEVTNGVVSLLTISFLIFVTIYLIEESKIRRLTLVDWLALPAGMALALALYIQNTGQMISRGTVWVWRVTTGGRIPLSDADLVLLIIGAGLTGAGLLLAISVFSRARFGDWPWITSAALTMGYVLLSLLLH